MIPGLRSVLLILLLLLSFVTQANEGLRVAFINPDRAGDQFWDLVTAFMLAAAEDLDIELDIHYADQNRFRTAEIVDSLVASPRPPDYLVFMYQVGVGKVVLETAERHGIKSFIINTEILQQDREDVGLPRERFKRWIGQMYPDDEYAGRRLAGFLLSRAVTNKRFDAEGRIPILGFGGSYESSPAIRRNDGLQKAASAYERADLNQIVDAQWRSDRVREQLPVLARRYPETTVIWAASDSMALAAIDVAAKQTSLKQPIVGGIDWTEAGLAAIKSGQMTASVGGHFMEGGWALILLHDYHHGRDFADQGLVMQSKMDLIHSGNVDAYCKQLLDYHFRSVDFRRFSRVMTPDLTRYRFDPNLIFSDPQNTSSLRPGDPAP